MVVVASVGEERLHGIDQEVVIDQVGGYAGGQELLELFENGVFSRARETALRTTILPPRACWIGLFLRTRCNRQSSRSHCIIAKERPFLQAFRDWVGESCALDYSQDFQSWVL